MSFFCTLPWTEVFISHNLVSPCCVYNSQTAETPLTYFSSDEIRKVKETLLKGEVPTGCSACHFTERLNGHSFRLLSNKFESVARNEIELLGPSKFNIKHLQMTSSNICNLQCSPCNGVGSYIRGKELYELGLGPSPTLYVNENLGEYENIDYEKVTLSGGEPFSDKVSFEFINKLIANGKSKNIEIHINSNMTLITEDKLDLLKNNFKDVLIKGSIDGYGEVNDYLRYPSEWNTITNALKMIQSRGINFILTTALSNIALLRYDELVKWANDNMVNDLFISMVSMPSELTCDLLPLELKKKTLTKLLLIKDEFYGKMSDRTDYAIDSCIALCSSETNNLDEFSNTIGWLKKHDTIRDTDIFKIFPELQDYE